MDANGWSLRDLYRTLETPGDNKLRAAHTAVRAAYGLKEKEDILAFLLNLNLALAATESKGDPSEVSRNGARSRCISALVVQPIRESVDKCS